ARPMGAATRGSAPVSLRPIVLLALSCALHPGAAGAAPVHVWTEARDLLARLFSPAETCELGEEVVGGRVEPGAHAVVVPVAKKAWAAAVGGEEAAKPYIKARLAGWPARVLRSEERRVGAERGWR